MGYTRDDAQSLALRAAHFAHKKGTPGEDKARDRLIFSLAKFADHYCKGSLTRNRVVASATTQSFSLVLDLLTALEDTLFRGDLHPDNSRNAQSIIGDIRSVAEVYTNNETNDF